ncbi:MAG: SHOCT domain-containing protein [Candidatus Kaiserbacteria bacterium]|nr:SHOCT domain-containing protein [Candidatus Kaiserbacteria bacterium]
MFVIYQEGGKEKRAKIEHFSFFTAATIGNLSRLTTYFTPWEQAINDARFGKNTQHSSGLDDLEKLSQLRDKGVITDEEFSAKKKQLLGL